MFSKAVSEISRWNEKGSKSFTERDEKPINGLIAYGHVHYHKWKSGFWCHTEIGNFPAEVVHSMYLYVLAFPIEFFKHGNITVQALHHAFFADTDKFDGLKKAVHEIVIKIFCDDDQFFLGFIRECNAQVGEYYLLPVTEDIIKQEVNKVSEQVDHEPR